MSAMFSLTHISHNTNLSLSVWCDKTILLSNQTCSKFNFNKFTTNTRSNIRSIKVNNIVIILHTTHSLPSPFNSVNISNTSCTLSFSQKCKRKSIIFLTISICQVVVNLFWFLNHKSCQRFFIRITSSIIDTSLYLSKFIHNF